MKNALAALLLAACIVPASAQQPQSQFDEPDPQGGPVLCAWMYYVYVQAIGERCFPNQRSEMSAVIDESVEKIEKFILDNSPATPEQIAQGRNRFRSRVIDDPRGPYCAEDKDPVRMYRAMQGVGAQTMRDSIVKLLAIPRKPIFNECL